MGILKDLWNKICTGYVYRQVETIQYPDFESGFVVREKICFSGKVQKVGFRLQVCLIADKLGLTGWVKNHISGDVLAEIQGEKSRIVFLKNYMKSLKRANVKRIETVELPIIDNEKAFVIIRSDQS